MEFILSVREKRKLAKDGYMYVRDKTKNGITYWRCEDYLKCKSRVSTAKDDSLMREPTEHSHPPNPARVAVAKSKARMRDRAINSDERTSSIIQSEMKDISLATACALPKSTSLQRMLQRKRVFPEGRARMRDRTTNSDKQTLNITQSKVKDKLSATASLLSQSASLQRTVHHKRLSPEEKAKKRGQATNSAEQTLNITQSEVKNKSFETASILPQSTSLQRLVHHKRLSPEEKRRKRSLTANSDEQTFSTTQTEMMDKSLPTAGVIPKNISLQRTVQRKRLCPEEKASKRGRTANSDEETLNITQSKTKDIALSTAGVLPEHSFLQWMARHKRACPEGNGLIDELRVTPRGETFVLEEDDQNGFYMFASQMNLDMLNNCANWFCDSAFDVAPLGSQLYTIHALVDEDRTVPLVYAVTENKSEAVYNRIFRLLQQQRPGISPETVTIEFEMAAYNALSSSFPQAEILGCFFHFGQCNFQKIQALSLKPWFVENVTHALRIKCFQALAFVPPEDVIQRFEDFVATFSYNEEEHLCEYIDYFETTWIGPVRAGNRWQPLFPIRFWNVYHRVQNDLPRTNNSVKEWHDAFSKRVSISHPTLHRLIKKIMQEQDSNELFIAQLNAGIVGPQKKRCNAVNQRLKNIVETYDPSDTDISSYLRAIAHNL